MSTPGGTCLTLPTPYAPTIPYSRESSRAPRGKRLSQTDPERARRILAMAEMRFIVATQHKITGEILGVEGRPTLADADELAWNKFVAGNGYVNAIVTERGGERVRVYE